MLTYWLGNYDDVPHSLHHRHGTQRAVMPPVTRRTILPPPAPDVKILHSQMSKGYITKYIFIVLLIFIHMSTILVFGHNYIIIQMLAIQFCNSVNVDY